MNRANKINMRKNKICSFRWKYVDFSVINIMFILCLFYSRKKNTTTTTLSSTEIIERNYFKWNAR